MTDDLTVMLEEGADPKGSAFVVLKDCEVAVGRFFQSPHSTRYGKATSAVHFLQEVKPSPAR
mgnify:CR=1 FL=1